MATYFWDLGFDFNAFQGPLSYLRHGLALQSASGPSNAAFPQFNINDQITFNLFNITSGASTSDGTNLLSVTFYFADANAGTPGTSPFHSTLFPAVTGPTASTAKTVIFSPDNNIPVWSLASPSVASQGRFLLSILVVVESGSGLNNVIRVFKVDPEMVVGSVGGNPPVDG